MKSCYCGTLMYISKNFQGLITYDSNSQCFVMGWKGEPPVSINYCLYCGGRPLNQFYQEMSQGGQQRCNCGLPIKWADNPKISVERDTDNSHIYLVAADCIMIIFNYCISCGGQVISLMESEIYIAPSSVELLQAYEILEKATRYDQLEGYLGIPDEKVTSNDIADFEVKPPDWHDIVMQGVYRDKFKTFIFSIIVYETNEFLWRISLKPRDFLR